MGQPVALYFAANGAAGNTNADYLSLADAGLKVGENLAFLGSGQLSVPHALLHSGSRV